MNSWIGWLNSLFYGFLTMFLSLPTSGNWLWFHSEILNDEKQGDFTVTSIRLSFTKENTFRLWLQQWLPLPPAHLWECLPCLPTAHWASLRQQEMIRSRLALRKRPSTDPRWAKRGKKPDVRDHGVACLDAVERGWFWLWLFTRELKIRGSQDSMFFFHHGGSWLFSNCREEG